MAATRSTMYKGYKKLKTLFLKKTIPQTLNRTLEKLGYVSIPSVNKTLGKLRTVKVNGIPETRTLLLYPRELWDAGLYTGLLAP